MKQLTNRFIVSMLVLVSIMLIAQDSSAQNRPRHFVADTGVLNLTPNRKLRVTVTPTSDNETPRIRYRRCLYTEQNPGVFVATSTMISPFMMLPSNEARFFDVFVDLTATVRARVASNSPRIVVTFQLIDTSTGEIEWAMVPIVSEEDIWASAN